MGVAWWCNTVAFNALLTGQTKCGSNPMAQLSSCGAPPRYCELGDSEDDHFDVPYCMAHQFIRSINGGFNFLQDCSGHESLTYKAQFAKF